MGVFSFLTGQKEDPKSIAEQQKRTVQEWVPVADIKDGIIHLKDGNFVKILEVVPINFKLKSKAERRLLIFNYRAFLKGCRFPIQISIQCRKANIEPHIRRMKNFYDTEKNIKVKEMIKGYINLVTLVGSQGTITRRYFMVVPFVMPVGLREVTYNDVIKQLKDKYTLVKDYLHACGNEVLDGSDTEFAVNVLYSYLNKKTCEVQKIGKKLISLMGTFLDTSVDQENEDEEEDGV